MTNQLPITVTGRVVRGAGRGRTLGFPTANLDVGLPDEFPFGIYAGWATVNQLQHPAVVYWGRRPTFGGETAICEVRLLDGELKLYGRALTVELIQFLRPDQRFASPAELSAAIAADTKQAQKLLGLDPQSA